MSITVSAKQSLRNNMKQILRSLSESSIRQQSALIFNKLLALESYQRSSRIGVYLSMKDEVQTDAIVQNILHSGKQCFIPWYNKDVMKMVKLNSAEDLANLPLTKWNIRQPSDTTGREDAITSGGLDLVLVPGMGFTLDGKRLGRGKGYYDKFLAQMAENNDRVVHTVGLSFKEQILEDIPCLEHDFILDIVLTPDSSSKST